MEQRLFIDVAVELPVRKVFTYMVPERFIEQADIGIRVLVPFRKRLVTGYIVGLTKKSNIVGLREISDIVDIKPLFDKKRLKFFQWISSYYHAPLGQVLSLTCPGDINVKSKRFFFITDDGRAALSSVNGIMADILASARRGVSLATLSRRFKNKSVHSTINNLLKKGFLREEIKLTGGKGPKFERVAAIARDDVDATEFKLRAPMQASILSRLMDSGEKSIRLLRRELGAVDQPLQKLEKRGLVTISGRRVERDPLASVTKKPIPLKANKQQKDAIREIKLSLKLGEFSPFLLCGVTGSGKTFVYLKVIEEAIASGKGVIFLVPEISLTSWPLGYLSHIYPGRIAVMHSSLSAGERYDQWRRIREGEIYVVIGARSALFSPLRNPGLIVLDEEHDVSYKQEDGVRYNARDVALMMGKHFGLTVLMGSATPSIESFYNARIGKFRALHLTKRVEDKPLPAIEIVDMRGGGDRKKKGGTVISDRLKGEIKGALAMGNQVLLFLNRRGFSRFLICRDCGYTFRCPNCSVTLTIHRRQRILLCHYCDFSLKIPDLCRACSSLNLSNIGVGTEQVEEEIMRLFPEARVRRMDRDAVRKKGSHSMIIEAVEKGEVDILIGTQMIAKGHHFPLVTLVGIISGDTAMNIPDFRGSERTYQMIIQAGGRAGRGDRRGKVIVQSYNPESECFKRVITHDYEAFFEDELRARKEAGYPPFTRLVNIRMEGNKEEKVISAIEALKKFGDRLLSSSRNGVKLLGPAPSFLSRLKGKYRWQILIKGKNVKGLHDVVGRMESEFGRRRHPGVTMQVDVDPIGFI